MNQSIKKHIFGSIYITLGAILMLYHLGFLHHQALKNVINTLTNFTILATIGYGVILAGMSHVVIAWLDAAFERLRTYGERHRVNKIVNSTVRGWIYIALGTILFLNQHDLLGSGPLSKLLQLILIMIILGIIGHGLALTGLNAWLYDHLLRKLPTSGTDLQSSTRDLSHEKNNRERGLLYFIIGLFLILSLAGILNAFSGWILFSAACALLLYGGYLLDLHIKLRTLITPDQKQ